MNLKKQSNSSSQKTLLFSVIGLLHASGYQKSFLWIFVSLIVSVFVFSLDDQQAIQFYVDKLQQLSIHRLSQYQKLWIQNFYLNDHNDAPLKAKKRQTRHKFNQRKKQLIREWEAHYSLKWPQIKLTKRVKNRHELQASTINFEAHHIIPINAGGINVMWNISPLSSKNHKLLYESMEEKACFSHDYFHKKFIRFILNVKDVFSRFLKPHINQKEKSYAKG